MNALPLGFQQSALSVGPAPVLQYELEYREAGGNFVTPTYIIDPLNCTNCVNPVTGKIKHTISNLNQNAVYQIRVRTVCEN